MAIGELVEETPLNATMALEIKKAISGNPVQFSAWKRAGEIDLALEAIIQGRHVVKPAEVDHHPV